MASTTLSFDGAVKPWQQQPDESSRPAAGGGGLATRDVQCGVPVMRLVAKTEKVVAKTEKVIGTPTRDDSRSSPIGPDIVRSACANG
jgi:hypothetical protein